MMRPGMAGGDLSMGPQQGQVPSCKGQAEEPHDLGLGIGASVGSPTAAKCLCLAPAGMAQGPQTHQPQPLTLQGKIPVLRHNIPGRL